MAQAEQAIVDVAAAGRASVAARVGEGTAAHPGDLELSAVMDRYERLGNEPPRFDIAANDVAFGHLQAHTGERHGPDVPLRRDPAMRDRTLEGRIYGDPPWTRRENWSYRWDDASTMNRMVNRYVQENWEAIRSDLALSGNHRGGFAAGQRVGEGFYNTGMHGAGPPDAKYAITGMVDVRIKVVPGSDPPVPFVVSAFPAGIL